MATPPKTQMILIYGPIANPFSLLYLWSQLQTKEALKETLYVLHSDRKMQTNTPAPIISGLELSATK